MTQKERVIFRPSALTKVTIKNEPVGIFQFCFQLWEAWKQLVNILSGLCSVVSKISQKVDQMHESTLFSC